MSWLLGLLFRCTKILVAACLLAASLWALLLPPIFPASSRSVVNAHSVQIEAAFPGVVEGLDGRDRQAVQTGQHIASLTRDQRSLERELENLEFSLQTLIDKRKSLKLNIDLRRRDIEKSRQTLTGAQQAAERALRRRYEEAASRVELYSRLHRARRAKLERLKPLYEDSIITAGQWSRAQEEEIETEENLQHASSELNRLRGELDNLDTGIAIADGHGSDGLQSRIETHEQEVRNLEIQKLDVEADMEVVKRRIASTRKYLNDNEAYNMTSPVEGVIWRRDVLNGQMVLEGQRIVEIADGNGLFVEAYFDRHLVDSVSVGDTAHIYLVGDETFIDGRVVDIRVQEQSRSGRQIINSIPPHASTLLVIIQADEGALSTDQIGQRARVMISSAEPGLVERVMVTLSFMLRGHAQ